MGTWEAWKIWKTWEHGEVWHGKHASVASHPAVGRVLNYPLRLCWVCSSFWVLHVALAGIVCCWLTVC